MKPTNFLMLISGRSGSSYLRKLIDQDDRITMLGEMFVGKSDRQQKQIIQNFWQRKMQGKTYDLESIIGFKTKINDIKDKTYALEQINQNNPIVIINRRKNYLKQAISRMRMLVLLDNSMAKYGEPHHSPVSREDIVDRIQIDVDTVYKYTRDFEQRDEELVAFANLLKNRVETIYYEDFELNPHKAIARLSQILGIDIQVKNYNVTYKNTNRDLSKAIDNYSELKARLANTKYMSMLEEK